MQSRLLDVGSAVATPPGSASAAKLQRTRFGAAAVTRLEAAVDALDAALPPLRAFILPSGGRAGAALHAARSVCRRAERAVVPLVRAGEVEPDVGAYLNRLSDYLFAAARTAVRRKKRVTASRERRSRPARSVCAQAVLAGKPEVTYQKQ